MKRRNQTVLIGIIVVFFLLTASGGYCNPETSTPSKASAPSSNGIGAVSVTNTKSPVTLKGLYSSRAASQHRDPTGNAIVSGLRWLQNSQNIDGSWGEWTNEFDAATGLALLAFFARGETPASSDFGETVEKGIKFLVLDMQQTNSLTRKGQPPAFGHAISTWAVCEAYSMTRIAFLKPVAEAALAVILKGQRQSGLWDGFYRIAEGGDDIDASIWQVLALKYGLLAGVMEEKGLRDGLRKSSEAMKRVLEEQPDAGTAAGAVLCLQLCGEGRSPVCRAALKSLETLVPDWQSPSFKDPMFRWHLATQAFFHEGAQYWVRWSRLFSPMLVKYQVVQQDAQGKDAGYWDSPGSGERNGRVYATALSLLMLEVYQQRYLPTYQPLPPQKAGDAAAEDIKIKIE